MTGLRKFAIGACLASLCLAQQPPPVKQRRCPDTPIRMVDAKTIKASQYRGKVLMIAMFRSDDANCVAALKLLDKMQKEYGPRGFQVIGVSLDESSANLLPLQARYRFSFPLGHLEPPGARELAGLPKDARPFVPLLTYIDWRGNVRFQYQGNDPMLAGADAEKSIRTLATGLIHQAELKEGPQYSSK